MRSRAWTIGSIVIGSNASGSNAKLACGPSSLVFVSPLIFINEDTGDANM
jgi:hypothetical protein